MASSPTHRPTSPSSSPRAKKARTAPSSAAEDERDELAGYSAEDIREAALRLLVLAASYEHRPPDKKDAKSEQQLRRVLEVILPHKKQSEAALKRAKLARASELLARYYEVTLKGVPGDAEGLKQLMRIMLRDAGYEVREHMLYRLNATAKEIRQDRGPQQAADERLAKVAGISWRAISDARRGKVDVGPETPFGMTVGPLSLVRYVISVLKRKAAPLPTLELELLDKLAERCIQRKLATLTKSLMRFTAMQGKTIDPLEL